MNAGWDAFRELLEEEARLLGSLNAVALQLTQALIDNDADQIVAVERSLEGTRLLHAEGQRRRRELQKRGFGTRTLESVCEFAPPKLRPHFRGLARELTIRGISLSLTNQNNKALILAGMERLRKTVSLISESRVESPGTYRRRGIVAKPAGSVLVSQRA